MPSVPPPLWAVLPFAAMLLAIALGPIMAAHRWEDNRTKLAVSVVLALPVAALYLGREPAALGHAAAEYVSFMVLLGSLYAIAGGILLDGELPATPRANAALLGVRAALTSLIGNAPNFMVKAIAEESSVPMPGFFGYVAMSTLVLLPVYAAVTWLFL